MKAGIIARRGLLLACLLTAAGQASAGEAADWLTRLSDAYHSLNYAGTFIYRHEGGVETLRVVHSSGNGHVQQRLQALNGVPREILRDGDSVACILPDSQRVVLGAGANRVSVADRYTDLDFASLSDLYHITLGQSQRVADRQCRNLRISPRDKLRYGYQLCLDEERGMLLRSAVLDETGAVVEEMIFTEIQFPEAIDGRQLAASVKLDQFEVVDQSRPAAADRSAVAWEVRELPTGFHSRSAHVSDGVEHRVLSDGLATISVFIEITDDLENHTLGAARIGAIKTYTARVGDALATVMGEVPDATVQQVAENIRRVGE